MPKTDIWIDLIKVGFHKFWKRYLDRLPQSMSNENISKD